MCPSSVFLFFFFSFYLFIYLFYLFTSPNTMLSGNLSRKNIPKVFSGFSGGPWQLPNHFKWCALLPKWQANSDHGWLILKDVSGQCALHQFFFSFSLFFIYLFICFFYLLHPIPCCPEIWAVKIFLKFSTVSLEAHDNCQTTTSGVLSSQNHKQVQTTGGLFSKTFRANVPFVFFFFYLHFFFFTQHHAVQKFEL